jgi:NAD(P)-dependent dehydrogenase (short-subunit alcohol dehydrogenase family)
VRCDTTTDAARLSSLALGLARAGASVAVLARNAEQNLSVLAELKAIGRPALVVPLDVTDRPALAPAIEEIERSLGGIDILVNNAGIELAPYNIGKSEELVGATVFLASPGADFITGVTLPVDGGFSIFSY